METFSIRSERGSIESALENEGTNAARFAVMAALGPGPNSHGAPAAAVIPPETLPRFGLPPELLEQRQSLNAQDQRAGETQYLLDAYEGSCSQLRDRAFADLHDTRTPRARLAFLVAGLASDLERESVAAAAAILTSVPLVGAAHYLPDWSGEDWQSHCTAALDRTLHRSGAQPSDHQQVVEDIRGLARQRVSQGQASADPIVREFAMAPFLYQPTVPTTSGDEAGTRRVSAVTRGPGSGAMSTMVHGTWGWKDAWWYPGGDFHTYVKEEVRPDLYDGGQEFSWSGALSAEQRVIGGQRFLRWTESASGGNGLHTLFAFSYGSELVARAVNAGAAIDEVVFLSAPVHPPLTQMLGKVDRVVDIRLKFDLVLALARAAQRLPSAPNVTVKHIDEPYWSHNVTHDPALWRELGLARELERVARRSR
ncbi:hypothetical protein DFO66_11231 [Brevibacterium sanguinis]|uniref:Alpha/beta hydrolase family protein n=2 Tax=Brevibacterium TaxID=1696 RepID=A0A366IEB5_9MICO|nr:MULTISPECIES: hypothetical protein [Brevibacterium]RBP62927.1 hypothetical protein DFO66_11231 [Brevibacterium sanguinis]RBP69528.1 hypothetical protein DFO65_11262 [Brevibacterium celere]